MPVLYNQQHEPIYTHYAALNVEPCSVAEYHYLESTDTFNQLLSSIQTCLTNPSIDNYQIFINVLHEWHSIRDDVMNRLQLTFYSYIAHSHYAICSDILTN